jgi:hypothetical protein
MIFITWCSRHNAYAVLTIYDLTAPLTDPTGIYTLGLTRASVSEQCHVLCANVAWLTPLTFEWDD